jgi:glutaredoxin
MVQSEGRRAAMLTITLFTRRNCCLCNEAHEALDAVARSHPFVLLVVDVDRDLPKGDPRASRYAVNVPVVELDGEVIFQHRIDVQTLERMLSEGARNS